MRRKPSFDEEKSLWRKGYYVIGVDEVGRGAFAGPLVVGAVVYSPFSVFPDKNSSFGQLTQEVNDSKLLSAKKREYLSKQILSISFHAALAEVSVSVINRVGIGEANQIGFRKAIQKVQRLLPDKKLFVLVDGFHAKYVRCVGLRNQKAIIKGDQKSLSIASASIIAKVYRDSFMTSLQDPFSKYQFKKHKGYGTRLHREMLIKYGLSSIHRPTFCRNVFS